MCYGLLMRFLTKQHIDDHALGAINVNGTNQLKGRGRTYYTTN